MLKSPMRESARIVSCVSRTSHHLIINKKKMFDNYKPSLPSAAVIFTVIATFVSFIVVVAKAFIGIEAGGEGWWRWDGREAEEYGSVVFASIFIILSLAGVVRLAQKAFLGPTDFQVGVLGGSMAMYANMALCCFLYFVSFGQEQEEMEGGYFLMSIVSIVFALVYGAATAGLIFMVKKNSLGITSSEATDSRFESISSAQSSAHIDVMHDLWKFISIFSIRTTHHDKYSAQMISGELLL